MDLRARRQFPTLDTRMLRDYLNGDRHASASAGRALFRQFGPSIRAVVSEQLGRRYGALACDVIQEAWVRCLGELQARRVELLQDRPKRPSVGELMAASAGLAGFGAGAIAGAVVCAFSGYEAPPHVELDVSGCAQNPN
jgi:hypothetical protein